LEVILARRNREEATAAAGLVPDELVEAFTWAGTPEQVAGRIASIVALGVRRFVFMPHPPPGESIETGIRAFAQEVMPRLRALLQDEGMISGKA
jgi:alkanesulfonate monooxygenase SsuD/methylene tetrahydromethanopterin reductase-like flavin-dependent oxidoreductase (luciferase family)